ncbi:MAG: OmpA family protein [Saprospiraceae bacterium]|nr:OmpA family protein [Saprospiraceae bacterium]
MNLLDLLKNQLATGDTMSVISNLLGENKTATENGINAILPTLLGSVIQKGSNTEGANALLNLIKTGGHDGRILNNIGGLLGGGEATTDLLSSGSGIINMLLGDKFGGIVSLISNLSGLKSGSTSSLMKLAAPLLMGLIGKQSAGSTTSGLMSLLGSQSDFVKAALPAGIGSVLGFGGTGNSGSTVSTSNSDSDSGFGKFLPWIIGAALLAGLLYGWKSCGKTEVSAPKVVENAAQVATNAATTATNAATTATNAVADAANKVVEALKVSLPGGTVLDVPKGSLEDKIVTYLQSKDSISKTLWFDFDRLTFETGKATLKPESEAQLNNVVAIMKAFPKVKIKIGGYTDNVGKADANLKLSADRAKNVMLELVKKGVSAGRMSAEGYGDKHPIASNDTEEGRAQNRRISISVREK